jgi:arsenate reductase (glutaredoxin)
VLIETLSSFTSFPEEDSNTMTQTAAVEVWGIPTCGTTRKALKYLEARRVPHVFKNYREVRPTRKLLQDAMNAAADPRKLFNTAGASYRDGGYREKAAAMSKAEILDSLLADPMLIKRPIVRTPKGIVVGFVEEKLLAVL